MLRPKQDEPRLIVGVLRISDQTRVLVKKGSPSFLERDTVLPAIGTIFCLVPLEQKRSHTYSVTTT